MSDWTMKGLSWDDPLRIRSAAELTSWVQEIGFLAFFANEIEGFSAEEHTASNAWWTGNPSTDPWEWREEIATNHVVAYGKFFDGGRDSSARNGSLTSLTPVATAGTLMASGRMDGPRHVRRQSWSFS